MFYFHAAFLFQYFITELWLLLSENQRKMKIIVCLLLFINTFLLLSAENKNDSKDFNLEIIEQSVYFKKSEDYILLNRLDILINSKYNYSDVLFKMEYEGKSFTKKIDSIYPGSKFYHFLVPDLQKKTQVKYSFTYNGSLLDEKTQIWIPGKKWEVHIVHQSHHDLGYTDLPDNVFREQYGNIQKAIQYCRETEKMSEASKFRYVIEQGWSFLYFLNNSDQNTINELIKFIKEGRIEVTALLGNQTTELCAHEEQIRLLYPVFRQKIKYDFPIKSAEHNDIPGISWGMSKVLAGSGVKYLAANIQDYYKWNGITVDYIWDEDSVIKRNIPGAFWWKSQSGESVLFWYGGGRLEWPRLWETRQAEKSLNWYLKDLTNDTYPHELVRVRFHSGLRDNSPPDVRISEIVNSLNLKWDYPKFIVSTNTMFFEKFEKQEGYKLDTLKGEIPNTDYTIGAMSTSKATSVNRNYHYYLPSAETYATFASLLSNFEYPYQHINEAYDNMLLFDEHTWGMSTPGGPAQDAHYVQKTRYAYQNAALSHDIMYKSTHSLSDLITLKDDAYYIVVYNPLSYERTDIASIQVKPFDPSGKPFFLTKDNPPRLLSSHIIGHKGIDLPLNLLLNPFRIIDIKTADTIPHQLNYIKHPHEASEYSTERWAMAKNVQDGQKLPSDNEKYLMDIIFKTDRIPSCGYKVYKIEASEQSIDPQTTLKYGSGYIENEFYRISYDTNRGDIWEIYDKELNKNLIDKQSEYGFNQLLVQNSKNGKIVKEMKDIQTIIEKQGEIMISLIISGVSFTCPRVSKKISLYKGIKKIDIENRVLKDAYPHQEVYFSFPFDINNPLFTIETSNSIINPVTDQLPGTNTSSYSIQRFINISNDELNITWSSPSSPIVSLDTIYPVAVSQAHHGSTPPGFGQRFLNNDDQLDNSHIYSHVFSNNYRTNFYVSQLADVIFRYSFTSSKGEIDLQDAYEFGAMQSNPLSHTFLKGTQKGILDYSFSFCKINDPCIELLALKPAENGDGIIIRLVRHCGKNSITNIELPFYEIDEIFETNLVEENINKKEKTEPHSFKVNIEKHEIKTFRLTGKEWSLPGYFLLF